MSNNYSFSIVHINDIKDRKAGAIENNIAHKVGITSYVNT